MHAEYRKREKEQAIAALAEIAQLKPDWNGYGAKPFSPSLLRKCGEILKVLPGDPEVYPTGRQSIQFQYELADRSYLEFEVFPDRTVCLRVPERVYSKAVEEEISTEETERIREIAEAFYGQHCKKR